MLEWLICAASVATRAPADAGLSASQESGQADFFEFLADWDENDAAALDAVSEDGDTAGASVGGGRGKGMDRAPKSSPMPASEQGETTR